MELGGNRTWTPLAEMEWSGISQAGMHICGPAEAQLIDERKNMMEKSLLKLIFQHRFLVSLFYYV